MEIGRVGVWLGPLTMKAAAETRQIASELEQLGFGALWFGEGVGTKECFTQAATLLAWTERAVVATGIANVYARDPMAMANGARTLADAYPGRFLLGIGVSHAPRFTTRPRCAPSPWPSAPASVPCRAPSGRGRPRAASPPLRSHHRLRARSR